MNFYLADWEWRTGVGNVEAWEPDPNAIRVFDLRNREQILGKTGGRYLMATPNSFISSDYFYLGTGTFQNTILSRIAIEEWKRSASVARDGTFTKQFLWDIIFETFLAHADYERDDKLNPMSSPTTLFEFIFSGLGLFGSSDSLSSSYSFQV